MNRFSLRILSISICAQVVNEFEEQVEIEKEKAKERLSKTGGDEAGKRTFAYPLHPHPSLIVALSLSLSQSQLVLQTH